MQPFIIVLAQFVSRVFISLSRPDVVEALDIALFKQHGLKLMQRFQHLFARLATLPALLDFLKHSFACWPTRKTSMHAQLNNSKCIVQMRVCTVGVLLLLVDEALSSLLGDLPMNFTDVLF